MRQHLECHFGYLARRIPGGAAAECAAGLVVDSGLDCDTFNVVVSDDGAAAPTHEEAVGVVAAYGRRAFSWWVGPGAPKALTARLVAIGLVPSPSEPAMALDLAEAADAKPAGSLQIVRVSTPADLAAYARILAANWTPPDVNVVRFYAAASQAALSADSPLVLLLGAVDGEPVATAEVALGTDGIGGLYNIATRAQWRRRGFGAAMTAAAIRAAKSAGMRRLELQSSDDGHGVYGRAGFRQIGRWTEHQPPPR